MNRESRNVASSRREKQREEMAGFGKNERVYSVSDKRTQRREGSRLLGHKKRKNFNF